KCYECGKNYDYQEDAFCPHCGAFTPPPRHAYIAADGSVVRVDGLNEAGHEGSFAHQEFHEEEKSRRKSGLSRGVQRIPDLVTAHQAPKPGQRQGSHQGKPQSPKGFVNVLVWIIVGLVFLNLLGSLFFGY
ncbi:MAG: hypothetical protein RR035_08775, partial [Oscillibacter sp.]